MQVLESDDVSFLKALAERNELEVPSDEALSQVLGAWALRDGPRERGGVCVYLRDGEYVIDLFAVDRECRGRGYSHALYAAARDFIRARGGRRIFIVTKIPAYFAGKGFRAMARESAPDFSECFSCAYYGVSCSPQVMVLDL